MVSAGSLKKNYRVAVLWMYVHKFRIIKFKLHNTNENYIAIIIFFLKKNSIGKTITWLTKYIIVFIDYKIIFLRIDLR